MNAEASTKRPGGRSTRVRTAVHSAAVALVAERGADQVTLPAVAQRAGVNSSSLYRRWGTVAALLADVAKHRGDAGAPPLVGDLRTDLENQAAWTLAELSLPGGIAFFRAEVAPDVDERHDGLRECLRRVSERFRPVLDTARERGDAPPPLERVLDRIVAPLYFRVVFSIPGTDEAYVRDLVAELLGKLQPEL
ncbi:MULTISPECIES: TetR/AcrR family transcriptional regulator [unclassified Streptomyces]|uniref:TetR/AcrR family transcriptional regulator n=1 Tax=unclassified Streptomyces TaxID=2593676 RepID=UPI002DD9E720|nr:TetR/AcrR family transcriptional regulator [Streptomyces sp. NBC_01775]WSB79842.1 TetR/AcrR family transcriptional regulator [Streptomyces sp. NBC_01775]WSS40665.1 TetR/AcrR family transcriptional regulator [Streptomyces sp. NBC_01187]